MRGFLLKLKAMVLAKAWSEPDGPAGGVSASYVIRQISTHPYFILRVSAPPYIMEPEALHLCSIADITLVLMVSL